MIGIKDHKFKQLQKGVDLSFYEVLIHKHTVRKDKGTKDMGKKVGIIDRLYQLYIDFPCFLSLVYKTDDR